MGVDLVGYNHRDLGVLKRGLLENQHLGSLP
jgi:hypothetical protein